MKRWIYLAILTYIVPILNEELHTADVLFTQDNFVGIYHMRSRNHSKITKVLQYTIDDVDYDFETQMLFYIVGKTDIYSMNLITKEVKVIITTYEMGLKKLQVDWITKKIYFADTETHRIEVCKFDGTHRRILFSGVSNLGGLALSPMAGLIFYTDVSDDQDGILVRANMNGGGKQKLVSKGIKWPTVVTVDVLTKTVYWYDFMESAIEKVQIDGSNRQLLRPKKDISDMVIVGSRLFYLDFKHTSISSCTLNGSNLSSCVVELHGLHSVVSVRGYGKLSQPFLNSGCHIRNGGCSHLCLLKPSGYSCACPTGRKLLKDGHTCAKSLEKFIILSTKVNLRIISLDADTGLDVELPFRKKKLIQSVDYDPIEKMVYWADSSDDGYILRAHLNGSRPEIIIRDGFTLPDTPGVDWVARNLYWTCNKFNKIYVSRLDGSAHAVVIDSGLDEPRGLAVDPADGRLYWSDWGSQPKIESADLDGKNRVVLVNESLKWPNAVSLDYQRRHLYWVDAGTDKLEFYDLRRKTRHVLEPKSQHPYGISVMGDYVYWTDWVHRTLNQLNLVTRESQVVINKVSDIMSVKAVNVNFKYGSNPCQVNNYNCSHFCFHKPSGTPVCGCPDGYVLDETQKSCSVITGFLLYSTNSYIKLLPLDPKLVSSVPKKKGKEITDVAALSKRKQIFWVENAHDGGYANIKTGLLNTTDAGTVIQKGFYKAIGGIDVDWISENIYWSQQNLNRIEVSRIDGRFRKTLIYTNKDVKLSLVSVNPVIRKLYWFEIHEMYSLLYESTLNGSSPHVLLNVSGEATGLTIDVNDSRIYYITKKNSHSIESINVKGEDHRVVVTSLGSPIGLTIFRDRLYFCELENMNFVASSISSVKKQYGTDKIKLKEETAWFKDIAPFHDSLDSGENICDKINGGCEHLCFATSVGSRKCMCESHYELSQDNVSCTGPKKFALLSEKSVIYRISLIENEAEVPLHIPFEISVSSIAYNIRTETVYWLDGRSHEIKFPSKDSNKTVDLGVDGGQPISFAIDFLTNNLYWIDLHNRTIHFVNLDDRTKSGIIFNNEKYHATKLILLPEKGLLFFVNTFLSKYNHGFDSIECMNLDGTNQIRLHLFKGEDILERFQHSRRQPDDVKKPMYDIAVDPQSNRLYWVQLVQNKIYSMDFNGQDLRLRVAFYNEEFKARAIDVHESYLYWVDVELKSSKEKLKKLKLHESERHRKISHFQRIYELVNDIQLVDLTRMEITSPCKVRNGGCSHICYHMKNAVGGVTQCGCPLGYVFLYGNDKHCVVRDRKTCPVVCNNKCKWPNTLCSELIECKIGLTESNCMCKEGEFRCPSSTCVPYSAMCDGSADCAKGEDEDEQQCATFFNNTKQFTPHLQPTRTVKTHEGTEYSYTAGIISGALVTTLLFVCVLYIVCIHHHKKMRLKMKEQDVCTKFTTAEEPVVVFPSLHVRRSTIAESVVSTVLASSKNMNMRYITGSSTDATESVILPLNPPPSVMSSQLTLSRRADDYNYNYYDESGLPAPPATPLYEPSLAESIMTNNQDRLLLTKQHVVLHKPECSHCQKQSCIYNHTLSSSDISDVHAPSMASTYLASKRKPFYKRNNCYSSLDSLNSPSLTRQLSYLTSIADTVDNRERILPSLASEASFSEYASENCLTTVRACESSEEVDLPSSANFYAYAPPPSPGTAYAPPPSPGTEYTSDINDFQEFKDEEEAIEVDFLLDSHRSVSMQSGLF